MSSGKHVNLIYLFLVIMTTNRYLYERMTFEAPFRKRDDEFNN